MRGFKICYLKVKRKKQEEPTSDDVLINELGWQLYKEVSKRMLFDGTKHFLGKVYVDINENITIAIERYTKDNCFGEVLFFGVLIKEITVVTLWLSRKIEENDNMWTISNFSKYYDIPNAAKNEIKKWLEDKISERILIIQKVKEEDLKEHSKNQEYINSLYEDKGEK